ncbi:hypothetical protein J2W54_004960 [Rhodococcus fascians]|nr:hypothetical protein [Rhodococcus sp. 3258]MDR6934544.1 hypothetical protein [Rhodococcus fascians]
MIDDIDGSVIDDESGETIDFAVSGVEYVIDLKTKNTTEFHRKLDYYIEHATRVGGWPQAQAVVGRSIDGDGFVFCSEERSRSDARHPSVGR